MPPLDRPAHVHHPVVVAPDVGPGPVLAGEGGHDVDVVVGVPDRDPPHDPVVAVRGQAHPVHELARDLGPLVIGEDRILRGGSQRAVPYRLSVVVGTERGHRLIQQGAKVPVVTLAARVDRWFQVGRVTPCGHQMRITMLVLASWPVQVVENPGRPFCPASPCRSTCITGDGRRDFGCDRFEVAQDPDDLY
ncbi:MAG: hypothetical protein JWN52_2778 [Actinomycetia bacterium]|nr:hypothetical protein [Actinomycetes bacterium]